MHLEKDKEQIKGMKHKIDFVNLQYIITYNNIWDQTEEICNVLKENTRSFITELQTKVQSETNTMLEMIQLREDHIKKIEIINANFRELLQHFDDVDILLNFSRLKHKTLDLMETCHVEKDFCRSSVNLEYNIWCEKTQQMLSDFRSDKQWINKIRDSTTQLSQVVDEQRENIPAVPKLLDTKHKISLNELTKEMKESNSCDRFFSGIFVCDENYVWVCDDSLNELNVFSAKEDLLTVCKPNDIQRPRDICLLSSDRIGLVDGNLILFEKKKDAPFLTLLKQIPTEVKYVSICNCFGKILVCDSNCRVYLLALEGNVLRTVLDSSQDESPCHRISPGPFLDTFLLLNYKSEKLFCYSLFDSKLIFTHKTKPMTSDVCIDNRGNIYVVNVDEIYSLNAVTLQKYHLFPIGGGLIWPRIFIKMDKLYLTLNTLRRPYDTSGKCEVKIMSISYETSS